MDQKIINNGIDFGRKGSFRDFIFASNSPFFHAVFHCIAIGTILLFYIGKPLLTKLSTSLELIT